MTAPVVGPRTLEQLEDLLRACGSATTGRSLGRWTAPPAVYPQRMLAAPNAIDLSGVRLQRRGLQEILQ